MTYNPNIPLSADFIKISQAQLLNNFSSIFAAFTRNHQSFYLNNPGFHNVLALVTQSVDPTTASDEVALYSKSGTSSQPQVFFRPSSNGTPIQLSFQSLKTTDTNNAYQSFMAGPYVILFGRVNGVTNGQVINYPSFYPGISLSATANNLFCFLQPTLDTALPSPQTPVTAIPYNVTNTSFTVEKSLISSPETAIDIFFLLIGQPA